MCVYNSPECDRTIDLPHYHINTMQLNTVLVRTPEKAQCFMHESGNVLVNHCLCYYGITTKALFLSKYYCGGEVLLFGEVIWNKVY